jgi:hypothetical protein
MKLLSRLAFKRNVIMLAHTDQDDQSIGPIVAHTHQGSRAFYEASERMTRVS